MHGGWLDARARVVWGTACVLVDSGTFDVEGGRRLVNVRRLEAKTTRDR